MRPLVVLLLVVGALAALFFALTTDSGRGGPSENPVIVAPVNNPSKAPDLVDPVMAPPKGEGKATLPEESRKELTEGPQVNGATVKFGGIEGTVVDEEGNPIEGAEVSLLNIKPTSFGEDAYVLKGMDPPRPAAKVVTEASGTFSFPRLDPRKDWSLSVVHERFLPWDSNSTLPVREDATWLEQVTLKAGLTFSGFVRDAQTKQPIAGAVLLSDSQLARSTMKPTKNQLKATTDETGAFVFANPTGSLQARTLTITAQGYATQVHTNFQMVQLGPPPKRFTNIQRDGKLEAKQQDFEMEPGKTIAGRVLDPEHRGAAGILVEALNQAGTIGSQGIAKSKANGEFLIAGLAEGIYTVRVATEGKDALPLQRVEAGETNAVLQLFELASVMGTVVDSGGRPLSNFVIKARAANEVSKAYGAVVAHKAVKGAKEGAFELEGLPEGAYVIEGLAEGFASSFSDTITATQGLVTSDVVVHMSRGGSLSGVVVDSYQNTPIAGAEVCTQDNNWIEGDLFELFGALEPSALTKAKVYTDAEGRFSIDMMTPDAYQVQIKARGYAPVFVNDVVLTDGKETQLPTQALTKGAVITGTVTNRDGALAPGATIQLSPVDNGDVYAARNTRADANGRFIIENVLPGKYHLTATRPNSNSNGAFEAIGDMNQSKIEISIEDGGKYQFDLSMVRRG